MPPGFLNVDLDAAVLDSLILPGVLLDLNPLPIPYIPPRQISQVWSR